MAVCGHTSVRSIGLMFFMIPLLLLSLSFLSHSVAMEFQVGGKDGWVVKPSEDYNNRAQRHRFQVNDILHFMYKKENNSVMVVKKKDYDSCNINNPIHKVDDENSTFLLDRSGLFFFISGNVNNCRNGQKLIIFVTTVRDTIPQAAPSSQSPASVSHGHGWSEGMNVGSSCTQMCSNIYYCNCC